MPACPPSPAASGRAGLALARLGVLLLACLLPLLAPAHAGAAAVPPSQHMQQLEDALLHDAYFKVRLQAALLLGQSGEPAALPALVQALRADPHLSVRAAAAAALASLQDARAVTPLVHQGALDPEALVREAAQQALAEFPRDQATAQVLAAYSALEPEVRRAVLLYIGKQPARSVEPLLLRALADVPAVANLARQQVARLPPDASQRLLGAALAHPDVEVRRVAVDMLLAQGTAASAQLILAAYERDGEVDAVRESARLALRQLRDQLPLGQIVRAAASDDRHARARALRLLGVLGGSTAQEVLLRALRAPDPYIRGTSVLALQDLGDVDLIPVLEGLEGDPSNQRILNLVQHTLVHLRRMRELSASSP